MTSSRISVIIPNLNRGEYLESTLCSVIDQGIRNLEVIVVDGGSADQSSDIIDRYREYLSAAITVADHGPAEALNAALSKATGAIVGILGSDDIYLPGALAEASRQFTANPDLNWLVGQCLRIGPNDEMFGRLHSAAPASLCAYLMHDSGLLPTCSSFFRRSVFTNLGGFDEKLRYAFDYEFACRLLAANITPDLNRQTLAAKRETREPRPAGRTLNHGLEYLDVAWRYADQLTLAQRWALWHNCDVRRRIYTLAEGELQPDEARKHLLVEILRHPWWAFNSMVRQRLVHGTTHPVPHNLLMPAA